MESTILVRVTVQEETATQVAEALAGTFKSFGGTPAMSISTTAQKGRCLIVIDTRTLYTDEAVDDIFSQVSYDAIYQMPGVLAAEIVSSDVERPIAMTQVEATSLQARITREAPWLKRVTVRPAHEVNDDFPRDGDTFVCWIEGQQFEAEMYNATEWATLVERLDYEGRMSAFIEQLDDPDARPFRRYILDTPILPNFGSYTYLELECHTQLPTGRWDAALAQRSAVESRSEGHLFDIRCSGASQCCAIFHETRRSSTGGDADRRNRTAHQREVAGARALGATSALNALYLEEQQQ